MKDKFFKFINLQGKYLTSLLILLAMSIGQMWGEVPADTYYSFTGTKSANAEIAPTSGVSTNKITCGSSGSVASSSATFANTSYSYGLKLGNSAAKGCTIGVSATTTNPAHIILFCSGSGKDIYLYDGSTKLTTGYTYSAPSVVDLTTTKTGTLTMYASGDVYCYYVQVLYEGNDNIFTESLSGEELSLPATITSGSGELCFFRPCEVPITDGKFVWGSNTTGMRRTVSFKSHVSGTLTVGIKNTSTSTRTASVYAVTDYKTLGSAIETTSSLSANKTATIEVEVTKGTYYAIGGSGAGVQITSLTLAPAAEKHHVTYALGTGASGTTPTQADVAEGAKFTLHNGTTGITAPTGKQFAGWNDGTTTYAGGAEYTMGTDDVELTAQWENTKINPTATFSNGAYVVGASALDLSGLWSSNSDGAVTYALKEASDDASVTAGAFSATKAGSYVVTASQAATSTYNAISKEATITVTWPATGDAVVTYNLDVTNNGTTLQTLATTNATSSSISVAASNSLLYGGLGISSSKNKHNGTRTLGINTLAEETADKYFGVTFTVADDYMFTPSAISLKVLTIGGNATSYKAVLTDGTNSIVGTVDATNDSEKTLANWNGLGTTALTGDVTLKLYAWYTTSGDYNAYRLSTPITISGTVAVKPTPAAPSISAPTADSEAEYDLNDEIAPLAITATGYPTPTYQWYKNSSASTEGATALENCTTATYTPANNVASDLYYYCVATNSQGSATSHYFHVTVNAPAVPTIYTETTALTLTSNKIATASETFTFSGANLGETAVTLVLASAVDGLTLSESSVTPTTGAITDKEITVSYKSLLDVAETDVNLYLKQGDDILKTIVLTYSSTAGIESLTSISAATTWDWNGAADAAYGTLGQNDMIVLANADVTWDAGFNALAIAGKLQHYYRDSKYAQGHELKFNTTIPGRVTVTFSNTGGKDIARAPRITDVNGSYAPTDEADGSKNTTAKTYTHNVAAGDVLIAGFEMQTGTPANMLRFYKVEFVPTYTVAYAANGGSGDMTDANAYVAGDEVTLLANTFTPASGFVWSGWAVTKTASGDPIEVSEGKFTMPAEAVTVTAQWEDNSKVCKIGDVKYTSLEAALEHAADGEIVLLQDIDVTAQVEVLAGVTATIDLAGHKIEYKGTETLTSGVLLVHNGASLTINDSSDPDAGSIVSGEKAYAAIALTKAGDDAANPAVLVINGGIFTGYYYGITGNGSRPNTQITINGGTITATATNDNLGIYHPQNGTLTINGGTITAYASAIEMRAGELEINGGVFTATAPTFSCNPNGSGTTTVGAAIAIAQHTTKVDIAVTINGGEFNGVKAINESNPQVNDPAPQVAMAVTDGEFNGAVSTVDVDHFISGGVFDNEVTNDQCAENYIPKDNGDGTYGVKPKDGVAIISIAVPNGTGNAQTIAADNISGVIGGTATQKLQSGSTKLGSNGHYIGFTLANSETLKAGDVIRLNVSATNDATHLTLYQDASDANLVKEIEWAAATGVNLIPVPAEAVGLGTLYIYRKSSACNPSLSEFAILRPMQPMLTAFSVNGRDGVIDEVNKTVAVQIPYEADLDNLTIVDEVVWNEAAASDAKVVTTNGGAWVEAPATNTYRLTDKDGDYTDYTITLTRDVLKHTVRFMDGISEFASDLVEDGENPSAPATEPEKEDYLFQGWSAAVDGDVITDWTAFTITEDKDFYAIWASDGAINLVNKTTGAIDTEHFITGVSAAEVNSEKAAAWTNTQGTFAGINNLTKLVQYNATTTQTKVKVKLYSTNNSPKEVYLHKIVEGETTSVVETIAVASKTPVETEYYVFNDTKNRSIYLATNSTDVKILQVKVIESGDALPMFGQAGYSLNLNKGRIASAKDVDMTFEGMSYQISSAYGVIGSTEFKVKSATGNPYKMTFVVTSPVTMTVTESGSNYYVYKVVEPEDKGTANAAGTKEYELTAGTWIIESATSSEAKFTNIAFALPKCEAPVFENTLADIELCIGEAIPAIDGTATVSDGGDVTYKWYEEGSETVLATTATYTPTADGSYFVVATNSLAGHQDVSTTSDVVKVSHFASVAITTAPEDVYKHAGLDAELSVVAEGKNVTYEWFTCDDELGTNPVAIVPAETAADLNLTAIESGIKYYQVVVTDECGTTASAVAKVEGFDDIALQDVTGNMTWDFSKANDGTAAGSNLCNEAVLVNVSGIVNNSDFKSDNIMATANKFASGKLQASMIKFHATVPGAIEVKFANTGTKSDYRYLIVNGRTTASGSKNADVVTYRCFVPAGDVVLTVTTANDGNMFNFTSVAFDATVEMQRTESWIAPGELGTICYPNGYVVGGADVYEMVGVNEYGKFVFDEVDELKPGKPYLFCATSYGPIDFYQTAETAVSNPVNEGNMKGTFEDMYIQTSEANKYYFTGTKFYAVSARSTALLVPANRCYVDLNDPQPAPQAAPGRRRVVFDAQGSQVATGIDDVQGDNVQSTKVLIDGELFILRGEKMYDATGRLVK